jgi:hypothetical protein
MESVRVKYVTEVTVVDPDTKGEVTLEVYKHPNGGMFAIDVSFVEQFDDDVCPSLPDPFSEDNVKVHIVILPSTDELA